MPIKIKLSNLLGERKMKVAELSRETGINQNTLGRLYHEKSVNGIELETMGKLCEALDCRIEDLFEYIPRKKK